jgi:hypothetical protein
MAGTGLIESTAQDQPQKARFYFRKPLEKVPIVTRETENKDPLTGGVTVRVMRRAARRRHITRKTGTAVLLPIESDRGVDNLELDLSSYGFAPMKSTPKIG